MNKQISTIAKTYAEGIIEYSAGDISKAEKISYDLHNIYLAIEDSAELKNLLKNPAISFDKKIEIINEIFKSDLDIQAKNIIKILIEKQRFDEFGSIIEALKIRIQELKGEQEFTIVSAIELDDAEKNTIISKLQEKYKKIVIANWRIDLEILGGLIIQTGDDVIDMSLKNKLTSLSKNIIK